MAADDSSTVAGNRPGEFLDHRLMRDDGAAEIAVREPRQIKPVLDDDRPIETVLVAQLLVQRLIDAVLAGHRLDRIAGDEADQHEHEQRDPDEGRN